MKHANLDDHGAVGTIIDRLKRELFIVNQENVIYIKAEDDDTEHSIHLIYK